MNHPARLLFGLILLGLALPLFGCGSRGVKITGEVILPDNLKLGEHDSLQVLLRSTAEGRSVGDAAPVGKDGSFTFSGPEKKGLPPGEYKVNVVPVFAVASQESARQQKELKDRLGEFTGKLKVGEADLAVVVDLKKKAITVR